MDNYAQGCDDERERLRQAIEKFKNEGYIVNYDFIMAILEGKTGEEYIDEMLSEFDSVDTMMESPEVREWRA